ncbi:MAG: MBL fold metallo-hydrolase [Balneolaceae bacterium]|nr:MBL fold metallo-hydrolase [Balneolaceae bacterium]
MKIGRFTIEQLSEGKFEVFKDGSFNKLAAETEEENVSFELSTSSAVIGIDPILISNGENHILLDTGLGWGLDAGSKYTGVSNVVTNLSIFGLQPVDITHVILTHLHYDHAAGCTYTDEEATTKATFPNARYYLQKREWEHAISQLDKSTHILGAGYKMDDLYRLYADAHLELLEEDQKEILPGLSIQWTGGHTPGHQIVEISDNGEAAYYLGDLLPSEKHLNHYAMRQLDLHPNQAKKKKINLMRKVCEENACLLFYHSLHSKAGVLIKDDKHKYVLKDL